MAAVRRAPRCPRGLEVQTLIFPKDLFTVARARSWAKSQDMRVAKIDETGTSYRIRQRSPGDFVSSTFRTIAMGAHGVKAVVGCPRPGSVGQKKAARRDPVKASDITWRTNDLSRARVDRLLGADWVEKFFAMSREQAVARARSRAVGAWDANDRESHAAYRSLERLLGYAGGEPVRRDSGAPKKRAYKLYVVSPKTGKEYVIQTVYGSTAEQIRREVTRLRKHYSGVRAQIVVKRIA